MRLRLRSAISTAIGGAVAVTAILVSATPASAWTIVPVQGTGTFSCGSVAGHISFHPPLVPNGTVPETAKVSVTASGCGGGTPSPTTVRAQVTFSLPYNSCRVSEVGEVDGGLTFGLRLQRLRPQYHLIQPSDWSGFAYLGPDAHGNPIAQDGFQGNEIFGSYYSDFFAEPSTGAIWRFDSVSSSVNLCSSKSVTRIKFYSNVDANSGVFTDF